jgi:transposase
VTVRFDPATRTCARRSLEAAVAATCAKGCYFREKYYRLKARRGHKRAIVAVAHKILVAIYHVLAAETSYRELGANYLERLEPERLKRNLVCRLERLGYQVHLEPRQT